MHTCALDQAHPLLVSVSGSKTTQTVRVTIDSVIGNNCGADGVGQNNGARNINFYETGQWEFPTFRYARIDRLTRTDSEHGRVLNLAEIEAFDTSGNVLKPIETVLSSAQECCPAEKCTDGIKLAGYCQSAPSEDPWLRIDFGTLVNISTITVTNRQDCCGDRIVGATLSLSSDPDGDQSVW